MDESALVDTDWEERDEEEETIKSPARLASEIANEWISPKSGIVAIVDRGGSKGGRRPAEAGAERRGADNGGM